VDEAKATIVIFVLFQQQYKCTTAICALKNVFKTDESNDSGAWGRAFSRLRLMGVWGAEPLMLRWFLQIFKKITRF